MSEKIDPVLAAFEANSDVFKRLEVSLDDCNKAIREIESRFTQYRIPAAFGGKGPSFNYEVIDEPGVITLSYMKIGPPGYRVCYAIGHDGTGLAEFSPLRGASGKIRLLIYASLPKFVNDMANMLSKVGGI